MNLDFRLGSYSHWKTGELYIAYDITKDEETGRDRVSYLSYNNGKKYSRFVEVFLEEVPQSKENMTGQKTRFEFVTNLCIFNTIDTSWKELKHHAIGRPLTKTYDEFLGVHSIPFPILPGDKINISPVPIKSGYDIENLHLNPATQYTIMKVGKYEVYFLQKQPDEQVLLRRMQWTDKKIIGIYKQF